MSHGIVGTESPEFGLEITDAPDEDMCLQCGQQHFAQQGEYPCEECGLPQVWDIMNIGLMISGNGQEALTLAVGKVSELIDEARKEFVASGGDEHKWKGYLVTVPGCGSTMRLLDVSDLPPVDRACPCGNLGHWLDKYQNTGGIAEA